MRHVLFVLLCFVLGLASSFIIAVVCLQPTPPLLARGLTDSDRAWWRAARAADWPAAPSSVNASALLGFEKRHLVVAEGPGGTPWDPADAFTKTPTRVCVLDETRVGWPWPSFHTTAHTVVTYTGPAGITAPRTERGVEIMPVGFMPNGVLLVPTMPMLGGLVGDALLFGAIFGGAWQYFRFVRARRKRRRGLCGRCGYELRDLTVCPECAQKRAGGSSAPMPGSG